MKILSLCVLLGTLAVVVLRDPLGSGEGEAGEGAAVTISRGEEVDLEEHLHLIQWTVVLFGADW